jgi:hypothetical protein
VLDLQLRTARGERGVLDLLEDLRLEVVGALVVVERGDADATDGAPATFFSAASMRALVSGSLSVPLRALKTSWSVSPLAAGKCSASRS